MDSHNVDNEIVDKINGIDLVHKNETIQGKNESRNIIDDVSPKFKNIKILMLMVGKCLLKLERMKFGFQELRIIVFQGF